MAPLTVVHKGRAPGCVVACFVYQRESYIPRQRIRSIGAGLEIRL